MSWSSNTVWSPRSKVICRRFQRWSFFVTESGFYFALYRQGLHCSCSEGVLVDCLLGHCRASPFLSSFVELECIGYVFIEYTLPDGN